MADDLSSYGTVSADLSSYGQISGTKSDPMGSLTPEEYSRIDPGQQKFRENLADFKSNHPHLFSIMQSLALTPPGGGEDVTGASSVWSPGIGIPALKPVARGIGEVAESPLGKMLLPYRWRMAAQVLSDWAGKDETPPILDDLAQSLSGKKFSALSESEQAAVKNISTKLNTGSAARPTPQQGESLQPLIDQLQQERMNKAAPPAAPRSPNPLEIKQHPLAVNRPPQPLEANPSGAVEYSPLSSPAAEAVDTSALPVKTPTIKQARAAYTAQRKAAGLPVEQPAPIPPKPSLDEMLAAAKAKILAQNPELAGYAEEPVSEKAPEMDIEDLLTKSLTQVQAKKATPRSGATPPPVPEPASKPVAAAPEPIPQPPAPEPEPPAAQPEAAPTQATAKAKASTVNFGKEATYSGKKEFTAFGMDENGDIADRVKIRQAYGDTSKWDVTTEYYDVPPGPENKYGRTSTKVIASGYSKADARAAAEAYLKGEPSPFAAQEAGLPMDQYKPGNGKIPDPMMGNYTPTATDSSGQSWYTNGHVLVAGDPPKNWGPAQGGAIKSLDVSKVMPAEQGQTVQPIGFYKSGNKNLIAFSNGASMDSAYYDHVMKAVKPDSWSSMGAEKDALQAYSNGKLQALVMPMRADIPEGLQGGITASKSIAKSKSNFKAKRQAAGLPVE